MEWMKKCPVFLSLAVSGLIFSLVGMVGRSSIYKDYQFDVVKSPFLSLMMEGLSKDTMPWDLLGTDVFAGEWVSAGIFSWFDRDEGQNIEEFSEAEEVNAVEVVGEPETEGTQEMPEEVLAEEAVETTETDEIELSESMVYDFTTVTEDYFNDAVFIGDSRTVGLYEYGGMEDRADFFAKISLTIYDVFTEPVAKDKETGEKITVREALAKKQYGKVYLMLGINELGTGTTESFMEEYKAVVAELRQLQPDAIIFVEGIMRVTETKNETDPIFNNNNINEKNDEIALLADNKDIFYIDVNEAVCDENGNLNAEYTIDEIHLKAKYYEIWKQFLFEHGIVR